jgi:amidohydrolase
MLKSYIVQRSEFLYDKIKNYRRHLHRYPELSFNEFETMKFISNKLTDIGIEHKVNIAGTGIVGLIKNKNYSIDNEIVALRADMDALPISEENELEYKSINNGVMHACGHDFHMAALLGAAEILNEIKEKLPFSVKLIFQPGEEKNPGGASLMINENVLNYPKVNKIYALHVYPDLPAGVVGFRKGIYMASSDEIYITINGKGGHAALPHKCIDPIIIGAELLSNLQTIVSRKCDPKIPSVLSFGHFEAIGATNVIPSKAILKGTFRTMNELWRKEALELIKINANSIAEANNAKIDVVISSGYPFLKNDEKLTDELTKKAIQLIGIENVKELDLRMTSEDFAFYAQKIPACFFRVGVKKNDNSTQYGVHNSRFDVDENALKTAMQIMCLAVV